MEINEKYKLSINQPQQKYFIPDYSFTPLNNLPVHHIAAFYRQFDKFIKTAQIPLKFQKLIYVKRNEINNEIKFKFPIKQSQFLLRKIIEFHSNKFDHVLQVTKTGWYIEPVFNTQQYLDLSFLLKILKTNQNQKEGFAEAYLLLEQAQKESSKILVQESKCYSVDQIIKMFLAK